MSEPTLEPWDWLAASVTENGEGYAFELVSPAGGRMPITNEQRKRIIACVNALASVKNPVEFVQHVMLAFRWLTSAKLHKPGAEAGLVACIKRACEAAGDDEVPI